MAAAHRQRTEHNRIALTDTIAEPAAKHRREIDEARVDAENLRSERLRRERSERAFDHRAESGEAGDLLDVARQQQLVDHVQHEQCAHSVIREALPRLGEGEEGEPLRVAEEAVPTRVDGLGQRLSCSQTGLPTSSYRCVTSKRTRTSDFRRSGQPPVETAVAFVAIGDLAFAQSVRGIRDAPFFILACRSGFACGCCSCGRWLVRGLPCPDGSILGDLA